MATIGNVVISVFASTKGLTKQLTSAQKRFKAFSKSAIKNISLVGAAFSAIGALSYGALVSTVNKYAAEIDKLAKSSSKLGLTVTALQKLQYQGELTGVSADTMSTAIQRMVRRISEAAQGTGAAKDALKELGLSASELSRMSPDKQFYAVSDAMKSIGNQGDKVRLAMKLFDTEGVTLVNTMNSNLAQTAKEFDSLGISITQSGARMVEAYNDSKTKLSTIFSGLGITLATQLAAPFKMIVDWISKTIIEMGGMQKVAKFVAETMINGAASTITAIGSMINWFKSVKLWLLEIKQSALEAVDSILGINALKTGAAFVGTDLNIGFANGTQKEIDDLKKSMQGTTDFAKKAESFAEKLRASVGTGLEDSTKVAVKNNISLADSAMKATGQLVKLSSATKAVADTKPKDGLYTKQYQSGGVGSIQDYINDSPAGKQLQDMRKAGVFSGGNSAVKTAISTSSSESAATKKVTFELKSDTETLVGELYGSSEFIRRMDEFNNKKMNNAARAAAQ